MSEDTLKDKSSEIDEKSITEKIQLWMKRVGIIGFIFFFVKGLVWIFVLVFLKGQLAC